ncbi:tetratricopeptide repeat protein [Streptomyces cupreus]|uniref:Tetratricopeptide repeat protein n=1 Tax=Streptomyces cupreus TaxID=2759956 RepID=A0A7X1M7J7_9ACTN|nr:tetratricopeptide repeat protein [Streptomyces cupreus]MBC2901179.1 tetratricopeptide repeat protein [Streptomyces cupreus]
MSRLSRAKKREQGEERAVDPTASTAAPIEVRVPATGAGGASVGGVPVSAVPGEEIQQTVLNHLHRIALATGNPVRATIQDDRIGYAVPLQVNLDGSSALTGEPVDTAPRAALPEEEPRPTRDRPTHLLRPVTDPAPTFPLRAVQDPAPGTVAPPVGEFGPPPVMDAPPTPVDAPPNPIDAPPNPIDVRPTPADAQSIPADARPAPAAAQPPRKATPDPAFDPALDPALDPTPKPPTPPRGFDAVAEAVLGDEPPTATFLAEPVTRINEAVRAGRTQEAAELARRTVAQASQSLGPEHPEVLQLRELTAYIAYLAGDPAHAFALSLDLARIHHRAQDAEAAYGNVLSAATAWRAVRDPEQGLRLGHDLIALWAALTAQDGPAAEDAEKLESARTRMGRLTERVRRQP